MVPTIFLILLFASCWDKRTVIQNAQYQSFSDLNEIAYLEEPLFHYYSSLPIAISNGDYLDHNSVLFLTESANLLPIHPKNLQVLLDSLEYQDLLQNYCEERNDSLLCSREYFAYGRIVQEQYVLLELGIREYGDWGRHYIFEWRTYRPNGELISKIDFAKWSDREDEYFEGSLNPGMQIEISSEGVILRKYKIRKDGKIVPVSFLD